VRWLGRRLAGAEVQVLAVRPPSADQVSQAALDVLGDVLHVLFGLPFQHGLIDVANAALGLQAEASECLEQVLAWFERAPRVEQIGPLSTIYLLVGCGGTAGCSPMEWPTGSNPCLRLLELSDAQKKNPLKAAILGEGRGYLALAGGNGKQAVTGFQQAVSGWKSVGRAYDQLRALRGLGRAQAQMGDLTAARTTYDEALSVVETLAGQLERAELRTSFLNSALVREVADARAEL